MMNARIVQMAATLVTLIGSAWLSHAGNTCTWTGSWDTAPSLANTDDVIIIAGAGDLTWDASLPATVASWTQAAEYAGTVTVYTVYGETGFTNLTITGDALIAGGSLMHPANTTGELYRLCLTVNSNLTVSAGGSISAVARGYIAKYGPGKSDANGAAHGGWAPGVSLVYGSIFEPVNLGSGGGAGAGGGAIRLVVGKALTVDGTIDSSSLQAHDSRGAGGSVYITAGTLTGAASGQILANASMSSNTQKVGSGGRVAVKLTEEGSTFTTYLGVMRATGGKLNASTAGGAGTVYQETAAQEPEKGTLIIDNSFGTAGTYTTMITEIPVGVNLSNFDQILIRSNGVMGVTSGNVLDFGTANIVGESATRARVVIMNSDAAVFPENFTIAGYGLALNAPFVVTGQWTVASNGMLTHSGSSSYWIDLTIDGSLSIATGGQIAANYGGSVAAGKGTLTSSHGGLGGDTDFTGLTYGSVISPVLAGAGPVNTTTPGGGGGLILLNVSGTLTNNGTITATAGSPRTSGGGINITAGNLVGTAGTATIQAAGASSDNNYSGGGGRVAVLLTNENADFGGFAGTLSAFGGASGLLKRGSAGTVYRATTTLGANAGTVRVDNNNFTNQYNLVTATCLPGAADSIEDLAHTQWEVVNKAKVALVKNAKIESMNIDANSFLELAGYTLTTRTLTIDEIEYAADTYTADELLRTTDLTEGDGRVIVLGEATGTCISIR